MNIEKIKNNHKNRGSSGKNGVKYVFLVQRTTVLRCVMRNLRHTGFPRVSSDQRLQ